MKARIEANSELKTAVEEASMLILDNGIDFIHFDVEPTDEEVLNIPFYKIRAAATVCSVHYNKKMLLDNFLIEAYIPEDNIEKDEFFTYLFYMIVEGFEFSKIEPLAELS